MVKQAHTCQHTKAAANGGNAQEGSFRDAPCFFYCPVLINKHKNESRCIDYKQVDNQYIHDILTFLEGCGMKKLCLWLVLMLMLTGCGDPESFETMSDEYVEMDAERAQQTSLLLAQESVSIEQDSNADRIYLCDDFCVMVQTFSAGDLDATIRSVTGYNKDKLMVMEREADGVSCYECVWASAGEGGDQVGRMLLLDDGSYHYALSVMAPANKAGELAPTWQLLFDSFAIGEPESTKG